MKAFLEMVDSEKYNEKKLKTFGWSLLQKK